MIDTDDFPDFLNRTLPLLTPEGARHLAGKKIAIAGCGGVGGGMALTMCRLGVGSFSLADPANFDPPDVNRQWAAFGRTMNRNKAEVYEEYIHDINPRAKVATFREGVSMTNQRAFLEGADILVDCLDASVPYELRETMHRTARDQRVFSVVGPILGFGCFALCSSPDGMNMDFWTRTFRNAKEATALPDIFKEMFVPEQLEVIGKSLKVGRVPTLAVGVLIATALLSTECTTYLLDGIMPGARKPIVLPKVMFFDLLRMTYRVLDISELRSKFEGAV